jgi:MFS family permease
MPLIGDEMDLSYAQIGMVWGAPAFGTLLFSVIGGNTGDRFGVRPVILISVLCLAILGGLRAFCDSYSALLLVMFFMGVAYAFILPNLRKAIGIWFGPSELARATGIMAMGAGIGGGLALTIAASVLEPWLGGWRSVLLFVSAVSLAVWLLWAVLARGREPSGLMAELARQRPGFREGMTKVSKVRDFWLLCIIELVLVGVVAAIVGQMPTILVDKGMTESMASIFVGSFTWSTLLGMLVGPYFSDKVGLRKIFIWPILFVNIPIVVMLGFLMSTPLLIFIALAGLLSGWYAPILMVLILENPKIGPVLAGTAFGGLVTVSRLGAIIFPPLMGLVMDATGQFGAGFALVGALCFIPAMVILVVRETGRKAKLALAEATPE